MKLDGQEFPFLALETTQRSCPMYLNMSPWHISIPQFCWKLFHGNILQKQQKYEFAPKPEPMRTLSRVPLEHSWEGRKAWDCEVGLGGEEDAVFVTTRGWVNFHRNFY